VKIDIRPRKRNAPRPAWKVAKAYHQWLRGRPCAVHQDQTRYGPCGDQMEAAHTPDPGSKGMGTKASDHNAIPLCRAHHRMHTVKGWSAIGLTREGAQALGAAYWAAWRGDKGELTKSSTREPAAANNRPGRS
jgi:hypothetical protein